ncbi:related to TNA1 - high affinity nicotinic acid plasma membrane permease [Pseudozyma flocculosa]|uniref:Related to TNA1 - high affinity nicotinic acid plasma membrane permease n=1 Tax=Pseudozyma flocculosa TaxID=84751 RepID=A0A5C3F6J6_9BASI|nr:related to TNA1 - high affinity nicotinic acid plasma membrane permease [Pseudozyma flocculosa]
MSQQIATPPRDVESLEEKNSITDATALPTLGAAQTKSDGLTDFHYDEEAETHRANIGNARIAGLEKDLGMNPKSYQFVGPGRWIPFITFLFGLLSICNAFVTNFNEAVGVRFVLGIAEAGMLPSIAFYLARWYRKDELAFRCAMYIVMSPGAGAFGGLLASGILRIGDFAGIERWEKIFFIEGLITVAISIFAWFTITNSIDSARWLSEEEKELARARMLSEQVGQKTLIDKARLRSVIRGITAPTSLVCATMFFFDNVTVQGIAFFLPSIVRTLFPGKTVIQQQLLTVPPNVFGGVCVLVVAYCSTKFKVRGLVIAFTSLFTAAGYVMYLASSQTNTRYAASFLATVGCYAHGAVVPAWATINTNNDSERAGAIGIVVLLGNFGGLAATWTYLPKHAPNQVPGNAVNLAGALYITVASLGLVAWQRYMNARGQSGKRDHEIEGMTQEQIDELGSRHPRFLYRC